MFRILIAITCSIATLIVFAAITDNASAGEPMPNAPASISWLPHGYGGNMWVHNTLWKRKKGLHGFRTAPGHIGCWSHPLWGWDVNGYYRGPNVPCPDPADHQLPIGLIYPEKSPPLPPPTQQVTKVQPPRGMQPMPRKIIRK